MGTSAVNETPSVSVIICTVNRADLVGAAVGSVLELDHGSFEVLVIDQSKDDSTERALAPFRSDPRLNYHRVEKAGLSRAYNTGVSLARGSVLAFTDDDCTTPRDWLLKIEQVLERHPDVDLIYGQTLVAPELQSRNGVVPSVRYAEERKLGKGHGFKVGGMGANFAARAHLFERIGGFDEALGGGGPLRSSQDFDLLYRAYRAGVVTLMSPDVWVHHYGHRNETQWPATMRAYGIGDGAFYMKHIRCGDLVALRLLVGRMARLFVRELRNTIRRRGVHNGWLYVRSYFTGMRMSLGYGIDRRRRLYRLAEATAYSGVKEAGGL